jgi:hypothetical protein
VGVWSLNECAMQMHLPSLGAVSCGWAVCRVVGQVLFYRLEHDPSLFSKESAELIVLSEFEYLDWVIYNASCVRCSDDDMYLGLGSCSRNDSWRPVTASSRCGTISQSQASYYI